MSQPTSGPIRDHFTYLKPDLYHALRLVASARDTTVEAMVEDICWAGLSQTYPGLVDMLNTRASWLRDHEKQVRELVKAKHEK